MGTFNSSLYNQGLFGTDAGLSPAGSAASVTQLTQVNTTSYIDMVGVMLGLSRNTGETSDRFAIRLQEAARSDRSGTYAGMLNELRLQLGLEFQQAISLSSATPFTLTCSIAGVKIVNSAGSYNVPLLTIDPDGVWVWALLSGIASALNALPGFAAALTGIDGPALQLVRQSNTLLAIGEAISGGTVRLAHAGLVRGTELFSTLVPSYTFSTDGQSLYFAQPVPDGVTITYQYALVPFSLISCSAAILALSDPGLASVAVTSSNQLAYQAREFIWAVSNQSLSYWAS